MWHYFHHQMSTITLIFSQIIAQNKRYAKPFYIDIFDAYEYFFINHTIYKIIIIIKGIYA
jgi:hypothetical protein